MPVAALLRKGFDHTVSAPTSPAHGWARGYIRSAMHFSYVSVNIPHTPRHSLLRHSRSLRRSRRLHNLRRRGADRCPRRRSRCPAL